jgi:MYXO-CTERM domain-containing protein
MKHAPVLPSRFMASVAIVAGYVIGLLPHSADAQIWMWTPTAAGTSYDWNNSDNWSPDSFPNAAGATANVNNDIVGNQTIRLQQDITIGTLNLGDSNGTHTFEIHPGSGENRLIFQSEEAGGDAYLNLFGPNDIKHTISSDIQLGGSSTLHINGAQSRLVTSGTIYTDGNTIHVTGVVPGRPTWELNGDIIGNGRITFSGSGGIVVSGSKSFTGIWEINGSRSGDNNSGGLTLISGSVADSAEIIINGFLTGGTNQTGGIVRTGNNAAHNNNPGQRLTTGTITLNGGTLGNGGQRATVGDANDWQQGLELVEDHVSTLNFNSGYSDIIVSRGLNTQGTLFNITTLERSTGATAFVRSATLGRDFGLEDGTQGAQLKFGNIDEFLKGGGGAEGTTTMSIVPWMVAANANASAGSSNSFATNTANGIRALTDSEYTSSITAGADHNFSGNNFTIANDTTVNSLRHTSSGANRIATAQNASAEGRTLTILSGGVIFNNNNGSIGVSTATNNGTLNFGSAEGVVWANGNNQNSIYSDITGTGGLTKAGTGTLVLGGTNNMFSGQVTVSGGRLRVGDGTRESSLGLSDFIVVANGAVLQLSTGVDMISDTATITLQSFGGFNGRLLLDEGVNETVEALIFGDLFQGPGTYGSTISDAMFKNDVWFDPSGTGIITVIPEPSSASLALLGIAGLAARRRRRH